MTRGQRFPAAQGPPGTTSSGVPFAEPLLANSRNSSTDALRFPIRFNRAIGRPLNSLEPPRIPDPSPERSQWPTAPPPPPSTSGICLPALWPPMGKARQLTFRTFPGQSTWRTGTPPSPRPASSAQPHRSPARSSRGSQRREHLENRDSAIPPAGQFGPTATKPGQEFARFPTENRDSAIPCRQGDRVAYHTEPQAWGPPRDSPPSAKV